MKRLPAQRIHTGGAYDTVPEVCIALGLFEGSDRYLPILFDEAGAHIYAVSAPSMSDGLTNRPPCRDPVPPLRSRRLHSSGTTSALP